MPRQAMMPLLTPDSSEFTEQEIITPPCVRGRRGREGFMSACHFSLFSAFLRVLCVLCGEKSLYGGK